jgi:mono/diheme cytochrome c family protein
MNRSVPWLLASAAGLVAALAAALLQTAASPAAQRVVEVRVDGFGPERIDRCSTCHVVAPGSEFPDGHPPVPGSHPVERFGCASCHGGEPRAAERERAHRLGREPLLHLASDGSERPERLEAGCARCHVQITTAGLAYDAKLLPHTARGQELFVRHGCWACHRLVDMSTGERGPDLSDAGARLTGDAIHVAIADPGASPSSTTMPRFRIGEPDLRDLVVFLLAQVDSAREAGLATARRMDARRPGSPPRWPRVNEGMAQGADLMATLGCAGCHALDMRDGRVGPDLRREGAIRGPLYLHDMITRPAATVLGSRMPPFDLSPSEVVAIEQYLARLNAPPPATEEAAWHEVCARCHGLDGTGRTAVAPYLARRPRDLSNVQFMRGATAARIAQAMSKGVPGTPMAPWAEAMPVFRGQRVVTFLIKKLHGGKVVPFPRPPVPPPPGSVTPETAAAADNLFRVECSKCHGPTGRGDGVEAEGLRPMPRDLTNGAFFKSLPDQRLYLSITYGPPGSAMPGHLEGYSPEVMWAMVGRVRQLAGEPIAGVYPDDVWPWQRRSKRPVRPEER